MKKTEQLNFETVEIDEVQVVRSIRRVDKLSMEIEADTQTVEMFVEQLGWDNAKTVDVPESKPTKEELDDRNANEAFDSRS